MQSEPVPPSSEVMVLILLEMEIKDILRMSLVLPELFDENTWSLLCRNTLATSWDHYSFLPLSQRRKFVEIARRKCLLPTICPFSQVRWAIFNKRADILERVAKEHFSETSTVYRSSLEEYRVYFNRPMYNFVQQCLYGKAYFRDRLILIAECDVSNPRPFSSYTWQERFAMMRQEEGLEITPFEYLSTYDELHMYILHGEQDDDITLDGDNIELWLSLYSKSQKKAIISRMIDFAEKDNLPLMLHKILCNLYSGNHLDLAARYEKKFNIHLTGDQVLSNLATYYFNTGDDRGLYHSLCLLDEQGKINKVRRDNYILYLGLIEVDLLLAKYGIIKY
ncbi:Hypothetical protein ZAZAV_299 [Cedratvirus Zaza IHUMI]|uniref:Uncharacterized protein n=1 Tax=Cedratvirus Zaza IHUMI TaxID=2126979 RepID=A0A2R8FEI1_9VIRU|nr:Hypothetical protein ZAZAV_299 [Cedratvirus Zaza IHUMI]